MDAVKGRAQPWDCRGCGRPTWSELGYCVRCRSSTQVVKQVSKGTGDPASISPTPQPSKDLPVFVQVVGGKPYSFSGPLRFTGYLVLAASIVLVITDDWVHLAGIGAIIFIGCLGANPRLSPVGAGCLPFLFFIAAVVTAFSQPRIGVPIVIWSAISWLVSCLDLRMQMKPYVPDESLPDDPVKTA